jgi:hypothetical protein
MSVDSEPDVLIGEAEAVEKGGVSGLSTPQSAL